MTKHARYLKLWIAHRSVNKVQCTMYIHYNGVLMGEKDINLIKTTVKSLSSLSSTLWIFIIEIISLLWSIFVMLCNLYPVEITVDSFHSRQFSYHNYIWSIQRKPFVFCYLHFEELQFWCSSNARYIISVKQTLHLVCLSNQSAGLFSSTFLYRV